MTADTLRVAVIGPGWSGRRLLRVLRRLPAVEVSCVVGLRSGSIRFDGEEAQHVAGYDAWGAVLADPDVRAVLVCVPPSAQVDLAAAAVRAGKHVLVEKPVGLDPDSIATLCALAQQHGRQVAVAFHLACHPLLSQAAQMIGRGDIGSPVHAAFRMFVPRSRPQSAWLADPCTSGGPFVETLVHGFHLANHLLGDGRIVAAETYRHGDASVGGIAVMSHSSGCMSTLETSWLGTDGVRSGFFEIVGTAGSVAWDRGFDDRRKHVLRVAGEHAGTVESDGDDEGFVALLQRFQQACAGRTSAIDTVHLGRAQAALRLAIGARDRSIHESATHAEVGS